MPQPGISFRRVHGHIIPIKVTATKQGKKDAAQGAGLVAAGLGASAGAGKAYRSMVSASLKNASMGWRAHDVAAKLMTTPLRTNSLFAASRRAAGATKLSTKSAEWLTRGARIGRLAPAVRLGGIGVGSLLVGAGAAKLYNAFQPQKDKKKATAVGGAVATGAFITGAYGGAGMRTAVKGLYTKAYPALRALKGKFKL